MAGEAHQSALAGSPPTQIDLGGLRFELACAADDPQLRALLSQAPMPGWVTMSLEREPNYFHASTVEGDVHHTMVVREPASGRILGMGSCSAQISFLNGQPGRLGYLSQLRVDHHYQGHPGRLLQSYRAWRELGLDDVADVYLTSIVENNVRARRLLTAGLPSLPNYQAFSPFTTLFLPCTRWNLGSQPNDSVIKRGHDDSLGEVAGFLQERYADYQCAPCWTESDFRSPQRCRDLHSSDFFLAYRQGALVGCLALWDQRRYKQAVVRGYEPRLGHWRWAANALAALTGLPRIPAVGSPLNHAYLSHVAVQAQAHEVLQGLIQAAMREAMHRGIDWLVLGFAEDNPLLDLVRHRFRHLQYRSRLYLVYWDDAEYIAHAFDRRTAHVEVAIL